MRAAISLLVLLFSMWGAQTQSTQTEVQTESQNTRAAAAAAEVSTQLDVYAELKELRDMVVEQRTILKSTQDELKIMEAENAAVKERLVASETKVAAQQIRVEALEKVNDAQGKELAAVKTENAAQQTELAAVKTENAAQQTELTNIKSELMNPIHANTAQDSRISASEEEVEELKTGLQAELTAVKTRLATTETEVENLENIMEKSKVAFSAGLTNGHIQAGTTALNLVFTKIITNVGQAYNSVSGFFTAPVRGVYYFRFTLMDMERSGMLGTTMLKNGKQVIYISEYETDGSRIHVYGGVTLQLEVGDVVNLQIPAGHRVYDDENRSTFSGFLLFAL